VAASRGVFVTGMTNPVAVYYPISDPGPFGDGTDIGPNSAVGDIFGVNGESQIGLPVGYVSGTAFTSGATWDSTTLAALGVTPGIYQWTWGSGADADSFTLHIGEAFDSALTPLARRARCLVQLVAQHASYGNVEDRDQQ
jgi:hypothetical protein